MELMVIGGLVVVVFFMMWSMVGLSRGMEIRIQEIHELTLRLDAAVYELNTLKGKVK